MSNVIQSATSAVASLPALIIQRADPGLYNLLTNGVLQARLRGSNHSKLTCRAMAEKMAETAGGQLGWSQDGGRHGAARCGVEHGCRIGDRAGRDAPRQRRRALVGGSNAGGASHQAIRVVGDVTRRATTWSTGAA